MKISSFVMIILLMVLVISGCVVREPETPENLISPTPNTEDPIVSQPVSPEYIVYLYFGDSQAMGFNVEERTFDVVTPEKLIEALISGPEFEGNMQTIPDGTKLISVRVEDKIAYVDFSKEIVENHWGGSAGESMTIGSIVNTLALNEGTDIEKVQLLVEGEIIESLAGHIDTSIPLSPSN